MAQFQVPQFIEIEQKIIGGAFTMRQFLIMALGAGLVFLLFLVLNFIVWVFFAVIIGVGIFAVAFLKVSGRSFGLLLKAAFFYYWNPSFYLWKSEDEYGVKIPETKQIKTTNPESTEENSSQTVTTRRFGVFSKPENSLQINDKTKESPKNSKPSYDSKSLNHKETREKLKIGDQIQSLWEKISTTKDLIPKRENRMNPFQKERAEAGYEAMRRSTGEVEMAKRVDFT